MRQKKHRRLQERHQYELRLRLEWMKDQTQECDLQSLCPNTVIL
ncbi:hypothetical protein AB36_0889 [Escherichia coli 7-233-03_S1_C2]|nr:hypothetical protein AB36_0889 [Escherichia coli 7-233-03_S1_C2]